MTSWNQDNLVSYFLWNLHGNIDASATPKQFMPQWLRLLLCYKRIEPYCLILSILAGPLCCLSLPLSPRIICDVSVCGRCVLVSSSVSDTRCTPELLQHSNILSEHLNSEWLTLIEGCFRIRTNTLSSTTLTILPPACFKKPKELMSVIKRLREAPSGTLKHFIGDVGRS